MDWTDSCNWSNFSDATQSQVQENEDSLNTRTQVLHNNV